jgi:hypothetical protein
MHGIARKLVFGSCIFICGFGIGSLQPQMMESKGHSPLVVDFCFLLDNPDLIGSRRFTTSANVVPASPHAPGLESNSCPKRGASFTEELDRHDFSRELSERFVEAPFEPVSVVFEGTLYRPSPIRRLWFDLVTKLGFHGDTTAPITIRAYDAVGKAGTRS